MPGLIEALEAVNVTLTGGVVTAGDCAHVNSALNTIAEIQEVEPSEFVEQNTTLVGEWGNYQYQAKVSQAGMAILQDLNDYLTTSPQGRKEFDETLLTELKQKSTQRIDDIVTKYTSCSEWSKDDVNSLKSAAESVKTAITSVTNASEIKTVVDSFNQTRQAMQTQKFEVRNKAQQQADTRINVRP